MPQIQEIDDFKTDLTRLGNEEEIRRQRGEVMPDITPPEAESIGDLSALFDEDDTDVLEESSLFAEEPTDSEAEPDEFEGDYNLPEELLSGLDEELAEESSSGDQFEEMDALEAEGFDADLDSFDLESSGEEITDADELDTTGFDTGEFEADMDDLGEPDAGEIDTTGFDTGDFDVDMDDLGEPDADELDTADFDTGEFDADMDDLGEPDAGELDTAGFDTDMDDLGELDTADFDTGEFEADMDDLGEPDAGELDTTGFDTDMDDLGELDTADFDTGEFDADMDDLGEPDAGEIDTTGFDTDMDDLGELDTADFDTGEFEADMDDLSEPDAGELDTAGFDTDMDDLGELDTADFDTGEFDADMDDLGEPDAGELDTAGFDTDMDELGESEVGDFGSDMESSDDSGEDEFSLEDFSLGEIDGDDIEASEFSLGDLGQEFGVDEEPAEDMGHLESLDVPSADESGDFDDAYSDESYAIPDDEFIELKKTLGQMPRNLKLIIEELIGEKRLTGENLDKLIEAMTSGSSAREIGNVVSKITGKKVKIPAQYEKRTAEEFEKEKSSFSYMFRKNFIPMFRTALIAAASLMLLLFLGYRFVYTPLHAESLYKKGYEEIPQGNNEQANSYFERAFSEWKKKNWFYRYAESFEDNKQYLLAEEKYEQLLGWYPDEREAVLDYAELEFKILGKYPEAEKLLTDLLFDHLNDYEARLMLGDTYMEWAREIDPSRYEEARFNYAKLLELYGGRDEILFRMLRYFIRTDNHTEAMNLYDAFKQNAKADIEPDIYAELAGYLIDSGRFEDVREILMKARSVEAELPEIHYELARYFGIINIPEEEEKALNAAIWLFENTDPLTRTRNGLLIDSYNRKGMILYEQENYLDAEEFYQKAAERYDEAIANRQIQPKPEFGMIFSNLGDLSYYISGDYDLALEYYTKAELNEYSSEILKYKKGYIQYYNKNYREALIEFYDTAGGFSVDRALMYSTANTLFNRNDYYLAEGYYTHLLDLLSKEYSSINYLLIDEIPEHRALLENMMKVSNNLGVTKYRLYERSREPEKNAEAMVLLTDSVEYYDKLSRDPNSLVEPDTVNLSYLNSRAVFYPVEDYRLQIYQDIPKDLSRLSL